MSPNLPTPVEGSGDDNGQENLYSGRPVSIGSFHYNEHGIRALATLSAQDPELARKVVDQRETEHQREHASYRFGLICAVIFLSVIAIVIAFLLIFAGMWATFGVAAVIGMVALMVRVILTGEWSDSSWLGRAVIAIAKALGSNGQD